jgi:hypothetical protein
MPETPKRKIKVVGTLTSLGVRWTFLRTPSITTLVGDNCVVGLEGKEIEFSEVTSWRGKRVRKLPGTKPQNLKPRSLEILKPEVSFGEPCST